MTCIFIKYKTNKQLKIMIYLNITNNLTAIIFYAQNQYFIKTKNHFHIIGNDLIKDTIVQILYIKGRIMNELQQRCRVF
jgi:hypothetical protein